MRLTNRSDYAFRVLMYLTANGESLATIDEIAERYGISRHHLARVVLALGRARYVETVRGRGGGLRLARPAKTIALGAVARFMERGVPLAECFPGGAGKCRIVPFCTLRGVLAEAEAAFFAVLDCTSVDDLVHGNRALRAFVLADDAAGPANGPSRGAGSQHRATDARPSTAEPCAGIRQGRRARPRIRPARRR